MSITPAARRWSAIIDRYEASGLTQRAFCVAHDLHPSTLASWRSKLRRSTPIRPVFTELVVRDTAVTDGLTRASPGPAAMQVRLRLFEANIEVNSDTELSLLRRVLEALC